MLQYGKNENEILFDLVTSNLKLTYFSKTLILAIVFLWKEVGILDFTHTVWL